MRKKILLILGTLTAFLITAPFALAAPVSWDGDFTNQILQPLSTYVSAVIKGHHFVATSTVASVFPNASTTNLSVSSLTPGNCIQASTGGLLTTTASGCGGTNYWTLSGSNLFNNSGTKVGIGTSSPTSLLNISGSDAGTTITAASNAMFDITNSDTTNNNFSDLSFSAADLAGNTVTTSKIVGVNTVHTGSAASGYMAFLTRSAGTLSEKMRIFTNGNIGIGSTTPSAKLSIHDNSGGVATSTLEFSIASSSVSNTATTTLFSVNGVGSTTIAGALTVAGGSFRDNNGNISLGVGMPANTKCGILVTNNFAGSCAAQTGAFIGAAIVSDTLYPGYSAASFSRGSNANALNSAGANSTLFVTNSNTQSNDTAGIWAQTQTTNVINTGASFGVTAFDYLQGTGQLTNFVGFVSRGTYATAGPTVTNQYDFRADPFTSLSNGTTTNRYGVYLGYTNASITNAYGIYQLSPTVQNYFAGNTGFGSTSPFAKLTVTGGIGSTTDLFVISSSSNTQYLTVKSNGNIGIGTTTPLFPLVVTGTTTASCFSVDNGATCIGSGSGSGTVNSGTTGQIAYYAATSTAVSPTSSIFLSPGGNFGINSVNPLTPLWVHVGSGQNFVARTTGAALQIGSLADDANSYTQTNLEGNPLILNFNTGANVGVGTTTPNRRLSVAGSFLAATTTLTNLAGTGGAFLAVDNLGNIITTTTPSGGGGGISSLNGLTGATQTFATGTTGTDFNISSVGTTHTFNLPTASATNRGALSPADWSTFNGKQVAGNYITALTGDATASGPGSVAITLATVNSNVGTFNTLTVNAKGLVTAASNTSYEVPLTFSGGLTRTVNNIAPTSGFVIPLTASTTDWQTAFTNRITSLTNTGTGVATLSANVLNIPLYAGTTTSNTWAGTQTFTNAPTFSSMTLGSVLFAGTSGALTQDNANFFWDNTNKRLGLGSSTPGSILSINCPISGGSCFSIGSSTSPMLSVTASTSASWAIGTSSTPWMVTIAGTMGVTGLPAAASGNVVVCIAPSGQFYLGTSGVSCTPSSIDFKKDIATYTGGIDEITKLHPISFYFKEGDTQQNLGFSAQEVELIDPRLVQHKDGEVVGLRQDNFLAVIVSAIQQIIQKNDSQDAKIAELQAEVDELKAGTTTPAVMMCSL